MNENELYHYGVKGQKWGVRRTAAQLGHKPTTKKKKVSKGEEFLNRLSTARKTRTANKLKKEKQRTRQAEQERKLEEQKKATKKAKAELKAARKVERKPKTSKSVSEMSEEELKARINRLQLEKQYKDLMTQVNPQKKSKGKEFVTDILYSSGKNIGGQAVTYLMGTATNKVMEKAFNDPRVVNPKKGQKDK